MKDFAGGRFVVLVIDEEQEVLGQVTSALAAGNFLTCCCSNIEEALGAVEEKTPDLIICDTSFKDITGQEVCELIRRQPGLASVPVMYLSGGQIPDIIRRHDEMGGSYYLRKPFDSGVLLELADKALQMPVLAGN